jgi:hypothetical protein
MQKLKYFGLSLVMILTSVMFSNSAQATTLFFDDMQYHNSAPKGWYETGVGQVSSSTGTLGTYGGLAFSGLTVQDGLTNGYGNTLKTNAGSGWSNELYATPSTVQTIQMSNSSTKFTFNSVYLGAYKPAGGLAEGLESVTLYGYNGSTVIYTATVYLSYASPTYFAANWTGITKLLIDDTNTLFASQGIYGMGASIFTIDNLTINETVAAATPEPGTMLLMALGASSLALLKRKTTTRN